jgi:hypothetical protein
VLETGVIRLLDVNEQQMPEQLLVLYTTSMVSQVLFRIARIIFMRTHPLGSSTIPSGSISLEDGRRIVDTVTTNPSAVYTFPNLFGLIPVVSELIK